MAWLGAGTSGLGWQPEQAWRQPWRLWSASLLDPAFHQWCANQLLLAALAVGGAAMGAGRREALCLWLAWPISTAALPLLWPNISGPLGLSGLTHAAGAVLIVHASVRQPQPQGVWPALAAGGLALKLGLEHAWRTPRAFSPDWDANVLYAPHLSGAVAGALLAYALVAVPHRWRARRLRSNAATGAQHSADAAAP